jgi:hypothetical protein
MDVVPSLSRRRSYTVVRLGREARNSAARFGLGYSHLHRRVHGPSHRSFLRTNMSLE